MEATNALGTRALGDVIVGDTATFIDVPPTHWAWSYVEALYNAGVTGGCAFNPLAFCPDANVTRAEAAIFLERAKRGPDFTPQPAAGLFDDVPTNHFAAPWIEQLAIDGITNGCSLNPPLYCPSSDMTRSEMAVFLLRAKHGPFFEPPPATGTVFDDVPASHWAAPWIEQLAAEGHTSGCSAAPPLYCPDDKVTRAEMAVFLVGVFELPMP